MNEANTPAVESTVAAPVDSPKPVKAKRSTASKDKPKASKAPAKKTAAKSKDKPKAAAKSGVVAVRDRTVPADLTRYTVDKEIKTAAGNPSVHCGDKVAKALLGKTLDEVYSIAAKALKETIKDLKAQYAHLNVGMQRMNLGNRLRKAGI